MWIHLVQNSNSVRFEKKTFSIHTACKWIYIGHKLPRTFDSSKNSPWNLKFSYILRLCPLCMNEEKWKKSQEIKLLLRSILEQCLFHLFVYISTGFKKFVYVYSNCTLHNWAWSNIFEHIHKILKAVKNIWIWNLKKT